jgi:two-component system OmpR family sensor kinase
MLERIQDAFKQRDKTEAELRRSEERLRRFVADASHELRTPLAAVSAYAELFERGARAQPDDLARVMAGVRSETARMGLLVEDLLLLARLDEGRPLERQPVELVRVAAEAVDAARTVDASWPAQVVASQPVEVIGDTSRLRQVIDNLLANVRAHTPSGTRSTVRVAKEGSEAIVEVSDDGPGLSAEQAEKAFERFYRAEVSRSRQHGGTGLGLSIVAAIVGAHGGTVSVSDTDGGGATFTIRLPADQPGTSPEASVEQPGITAPS